MPEEISNKKDKGKAAEKEMSFWEHLEELRWHLLRSAVVLVVLAIGAFLMRRFIFDVIILAPKEPGFISYRALCAIGKWLHTDSLCLDIEPLQIVNIQMSGQFMVHLYISLMTAVVVALPYLLWEIWSFVRPALLPKEKKYSKGIVFYSTLLFVLGVLFSYFLIVPLTINFFATYSVSDSVNNTITLNSYISTIVSLTLSTGLVFELPIVVFFLTKVGILTPAFMRKNRKYVIVILLVLAAVITPPDVFSQIMVTIPMLLLYEMSIVISARVLKKRKEELAG
ncbi:MAG: twin-arginine translocase subunit TatC [Bacteroidales bacterium]|jgi:sec-independent protein translocase protein TatC|nr:twin-arginine translocase subunit TatC [Bacteroidales bacterium]